MENYPLLALAKYPEGVPLQKLYEALLLEEYPARLRVGITGDISDEELAAPTWEAAFVCWTEPEVHEVCLILHISKQDEAFHPILQQQNQILSSMDTREPEYPVIAEALRQVQALYAVQLMPALFDDEDHPAWESLDLILRCFAQFGDGFIYVEAEGYCDAYGELLLAEPEQNTEEGNPS